MADLHEYAGQDVVVRLAEFAAGLRYESLPVETVSALKGIVLNTLATTLASTTLAIGTQELLTIARNAGGRPESTIIGFGDKVAAIMAALVNGGMAHAMNFDDGGEGGTHLGVTTLPTALAAAEVVGGAKGRDFLAALAAGAEFQSRVGLAITQAQTGVPLVKPLTQMMLGYFGAAVSAGRIMNLTSEEMLSALGFALMQTSGGRQPVTDDRPGKAIYMAFPNHGGMLSALLSKQGLKADCPVLEGEQGLFAVYFQGKYDRSPLVSGLGEEFYATKVSLKPWPSTGPAQPFIEAALQLIDTHKLDIASIEHIEVRGGSAIRNFCEPVTMRQNPETHVAAMDNIFFPVATALVNRKVTLAEFSPEGLRQPEVLRLTGRMRYSVDNALGRSGVVEVTTVTGQQYSGRVDTPLGHYSRPLTHAQLAEKFHDCAQYAVNPLPKAALDEVIELVDHLEEVPDVSVLPALLSGRK